ncbi:PilZ domain-containing protein [Rhodospirillum centenum]|uniref:PilZ domain-containing protein n=1 Tax=Rhodospirillum centenum TaxID=34018 RepID=UPI00160D391D|nr:PilZ domain-containing protein [Rhodospirillum centenum]
MSPSPDESCPGCPDRREFERRSVGAAVRLWLDDVPTVCRIEDVSPGGAFLSPRLDAADGAVAVLEIPELLIRAEVRIVRSTPAGSGVEFLKDGIGAIVAGWVQGRSSATDLPSPGGA